LAIINEALDRDPANPTFLDTRGRIHLALGKWKDALADLEVVLQHAPATAGVHQALAEAYDKLGLRTLADEHRALQESAPPPKKTR
jgi:predicted Zn-dependent protease